MTIIPAPEFMPDLPDIPSMGSDTVFNVVPVTELSYGPLPAHSAFSSALNARCQGGLTASDNSGNVRVYAGDATKLYRIASPGTTASDVSKAAQYTTSGTQNWSMTIFGQTAIATNFNDPVQAYTEGTSALFADLITSGTTSLKAKYCTVIKDWLFLANTSDVTSGNQPQRTWWSAIKDPTNFPTPGTATAANNLSDYQDVLGPHGAIQGISGNLGTADGAVFFERGVWRIIYSGLPNIFDFVPAEGARGLLISGGLNQLGANVAYPTEDGFYIFDGSNSQPIGKGKIDKFFYNDLDSSYISRMSCCSDPSRGLLIWAYPASGSGGVLNRLLIYSQPLNRWTVTEASSVQIEWILRGATFGVTLESLNSYGTIEAVPFSLDDPIWTGNRSILAAFDTTHKYGYFNGSNLAAKIDSSDLELVPGYQTKVNRVRPLIDLSTAKVATSSRDAISGTTSFGTAQALETDGSCATRARGRYHRIRTTTLSGDSWNQFSGLDVMEVEAVGKR